MPKSKKLQLEPNDQDTVTFEVDETTDVLLVSMRSDEHQDVSTFPTWVIEDEQFPDEPQSVSDYPVRMEPLGDVLELKVRNDDPHQTTEVTIGFREKKLASA